MAVVLYKDGVAERVAPRSVKGYLKQGYTHGKGNTKLEAPADESDAELEALRAAYEEKFGKKPHAATKAETLKAKLEAPADE